LAVGVTVLPDCVHARPMPCAPRSREAAWQQERRRACHGGTVTPIRRVTGDVTPRVTCVPARGRAPAGAASGTGARGARPPHPPDEAAPPPARHPAPAAHSVGGPV